jgi:hypothetical protein
MRVVALDVLSSTLQTLCVRSDSHKDNGGAGKSVRAGR